MFSVATTIAYSVCIAYVWIVCAWHRIAPDHGFEHAVKVAKLALLGLKDFPGITNAQKLAVLLAALLHDMDDRKIFPQSVDYKYARCCLSILRSLWLINQDDSELVIYMIKLVSFSANRNKVYPCDLPRLWVYLPRDADRIEAANIKRTLEFNEKNKSFGQCPLFTDAVLELLRSYGFDPDTLTIEQLFAIATAHAECPTNRESLLRFYITDWFHRFACASGSPAMEKMMFDGSYVLAMWFRMIVIRRVTDSAHAKQLAYELSKVISSV